MPHTGTGSVTWGGPCFLSGMQCLPPCMARASVITPLLSRPCGLALHRQPSPGHQGTVLALALLFSLRVCGGFSLGLRVPLFKGVADSLGVSPRALCVYVYVCTCIFLHVCPYLTCKNALCSVP